MPVPASPVARVLRFGPFELDPSTGELRKAGVKLRLQGQPIQLLGILIENAGTLVTREELKRQLWPGDTFVDFDHGLHNAVARIRETLGDSVGTPKYIETLPRRGYRFIAPVEDITPLPQEAVSSDDNAVGTVPIATAPPTRRTGFILMTDHADTNGFVSVASEHSFDDDRSDLALAEQRAVSAGTPPPAGEPSPEYLDRGPGVAGRYLGPSSAALSPLIALHREHVTDRVYGCFPRWSTCARSSASTSSRPVGR